MENLKDKVVLHIKECEAKNKLKAKSLIGNPDDIKEFSFQSHAINELRFSNALYFFNRK